MNSIPLCEYNEANGSTKRNEIKKGEKIQVIIGAANVGDSQLQSSVVVDYIEELSDVL